MRGRVVTTAEYDKRLKTIQALYGAQAPADPAGADRFRRDAAKAMAVADVMENAEADRNIVIPDTKVRDQLTAMISAQYGPGPDGEQKFIAGLAQVGSSEPEVLDEVRQQYASAELIKQVTDPVQVTDSDLPAEFPKYAARLGHPGAAQAQQHRRPDPGPGADILAQLRGGAPFADLARTQSMDAATKAAGGDLGQTVTADKLQPRLRAGGVRGAEGPAVRAGADRAGMERRRGHRRRPGQARRLRPVADPRSSRP